jgi:hypothetical protein
MSGGTGLELRMVASSSTTRDDLGFAEIEQLSHAGRNRLELLRGVADAVQPLEAFNARWATTTDPATSSVVGAVVGGRRGRDPVPPAVLDTHSVGIVVTDGPLGERRRVREAGDADGQGRDTDARQRLNPYPDAWLNASGSVIRTAGEVNEDDPWLLIVAHLGRVSTSATGGTSDWPATSADPRDRVET